MLVINLALCTIKRIKTLSIPVLIIHIGVILTFTGGVVSSFGFVATVNIYEGTLADKVYRWDIEQDVSIGAGIMVEKLHEEYYPVPVKVGVKKGQDKYGLFILKTGESFDLDGYSIKVDSIDLSGKALKINVFQGGDYIGSTDTARISGLPGGFPFEFKLVAYMDPVIKKSWVDLKLINGSEIVKEGKTAVNGPLSWNGMNIYHTATNRDRDGNPYIGLQVTRDPGIPYVYTGFCIIGFGGVFYLLRRMRGLR